MSRVSDLIKGKSSISGGLVSKPTRIDRLIKSNYVDSISTPVDYSDLRKQTEDFFASDRSTGLSEKISATPFNVFEREKLPFYKRAANVFLPERFEFKEDIPVVQTIQEQQKAAEQLGYYGGTRIKIPFFQKEFVRPTTAGEGLFKLAFEFPGRIKNSLIDIYNIANTGEVKRDPDKKIRVPTFIDNAEQLYNQQREAGATDKEALITSVIYGTSLGIIDLTIFTDIVAKGFLKISGFDPLVNNSLTKLGLERSFTIEQFQKNVETAAKNIIETGQYHRGTELLQDTLVISNALEKSGVQQANKITKFLQDISKKVIQPIGYKPPTGFPLATEKGLPGEAIVGEPQPAFGLSIQPRTRVGDLIKKKPVAPELQPLTTEQERAILELEVQKDLGSIQKTIQRQLFKDILSLGGIRRFEGGFLAEELSQIPSRLIHSKRGQKLDEIVGELNGRGYNFEDGGELIEAILEIETKKAVIPKSRNEQARQVLKTIQTIKRITPEAIIKKATTGKNKTIQQLLAQQIKKPSEVGAREITRKESVLLRERIRAEARGAKRAGIVARKETKIATTKELLNKFENNLESIKRKQELGKFKGKILEREITRIKQEAEDIIKAFLPKAERGTSDLLTKLRKATTIKDIEALKTRVGDLAEAKDVRDLKIKIKKEIKTTKPKKQAGKPVGKFTPEIQNVLDSFRKTINLKVSEAEIKIQQNLKEFENGIMPPEVALENRILTLLQGNPKQLQKLLDQIVAMKNEGRMLSSLKAFNIQEEITRKRNLVVDHASGFAGRKEGLQTTGKPAKTTSERLKASLKSLGDKWISSWEGLMNIVDFNAGVEHQSLANTFSVVKQENKFKKLENGYIEDFNKVISDVYKIKNKPTAINKKIIDNNQPINLGKFENEIGQEVELIFTKDEMIKMWQEFQDPTLELSFELGNNFTDEIKRAILAELTVEDIALGKAEMELYKQQREQINAIFRDINGIDLPFNEFYSPIRRVGYNVSTEKGLGEFIEEATYRRAVTTGSIKSRVKTFLPIEKQGSLEALDRHFHETNYYVAWAKQIRELDMIFKDTRVRDVIKDQYAKSTMSAIDNTINDLSTNGNKFARRYKAVDFFRKKFTVGALMIKPALSAKQYVSTLAYMEKLNPVDFAIGVADFWKHPLKNTRILNKESIFIETRGKLGAIERDIKAAISSDIGKRYSKSQNFINTLMMNIRIGDKGAIVTGSWAIRKARLKQGIKLSDIVDEYEKFGSETQQSADLSQLSEVQRGGSLEQLFTMFKSSQRQYLAKELNAIKSLFQKGGTNKKNIGKVARIFIIYHVLLPVIFQLVSNFGGWDEEDRKEYIRAGILGSLNGLFIFGDIVDSIVRSALGLRVWDLEIPIVTVGDDVNKAIKEIDIDDLSIEDIWEATKQLTEAGNSLGIPVDQTVGVVKGIQNIMDEDIKKGVGLILGWSEYILDGKSGGSKSKANPFNTGSGSSNPFN